MEESCSIVARQLDERRPRCVMLDIWEGMDLYEPRRIENPFSKTIERRVSWSSGDDGGGGDGGGDASCVFEKTGLLVTPPQCGGNHVNRERPERQKNKCV